MAKEKLFTPEDFDKEPRSPKKNTIKWIIRGVAVIGVIGAIVALIFGLKGCYSDNEIIASKEIVSTREIVDVSNADTTDIDKAAVVNEDVEQISEDQVTQETGNNANLETKEAYKPTVVQPNPGVSSNVESEALKVIRGDYGNYPERKNALGDKYESIQNRVNQLKHQGVF